MVELSLDLSRGGAGGDCKSHLHKNSRVCYYISRMQDILPLAIRVHKTRKWYLNFCSREMKIKGDKNFPEHPSLPSVNLRPTKRNATV